MGTSTVAQPRAGEIGEPQRKWYIVPAVVPVPPAIEREKTPQPDEIPELEPGPERVPV